MSEADTTWCAAKDVPLALIEEYEDQMQIETVESVLQLGGKKVTIQAHATPQTSTLPPEKTESGYNQQRRNSCVINIFIIILSLHCVPHLYSPLKLTKDDEQLLTCQTRKDKHIS